MNAELIFFLGLLLTATGLVSAPLALMGGIAFGLTLQHPYLAASRSLSRLLLQASVVLLGFGMNLHAVLRAGRSGLLYTALGLAVALGLGWALGRLLRVPASASFLISCGTAICGGSAIAALAPITCAGEEDLAVSLGTVFSLNAVALLLFPLLGWRLHLTQTQFGLWSALAIHDTSSVVGATARFGAQALAVGTAVKLARALWIVPVSLFTAAWLQHRRRDHNAPAGSTSVHLPWFIAFFLAAAAVRTVAPQLGATYTGLVQLGKDGLCAVLFLIGTGLSRQTLARVGWRPMLQGVLLWVVIATASLALIRSGAIGL